MTEIELGLEPLVKADSRLRPLSLPLSSSSLDLDFVSMPPKVAERWCWGIGSLGISGTAAIESTVTADEGLESRRNGDMRRLEIDTAEAVDLLSGVLCRELGGSGSLGTSGIVSASETAMDEGREEKLRKRDDSGLVGVGCSSG